MLVTNSSSNDHAASRALKGTAVVAHASNAVVYILRWPASVERATLIQAARTWAQAAVIEPFLWTHTWTPTAVYC